MSDALAKTQGGSTPLKTSAPKPSIGGTPRPPSVKKGTYAASPSTQQPTDQSVDDKKGAADKEVPVDPNDLDKKLWISTGMMRASTTTSRHT
jgi:hypothetical protein